MKIKKVNEKSDEQMSIAKEEKLGYYFLAISKATLDSISKIFAFKNS